jgi:chemotaxis protein methyltransferase CheR
MAGERTRVEDRQLTCLEALVTSHCGLRIRPRERETLRHAVRERVKQLGLPQVDDYLRLLGMETPAAQGEWRELIPSLTNPESHFFRDHAQMALLRDTLLPELIARNRPQQRLRLWSPGCSRGQEPYSLAMLLQQLLPDWSQWNLAILGTDINEEYLATARRGVYGDWSFRSLDPAIRKRYFRPVPGGHQIDDSLRSMVTFREHNLVRDACPDPASGLRELDLILCRNVFIYFTPESIRLVLPRLAAALREDGCLITGHAEIQDQPREAFEVRHYPGAIVYRRIGASASPEARRWPDTARRVEASAATWKGGSVTAPERVERPAGSETAPYADLCLEARRHANQGELDRASELCRDAVAMEPLGPTAYQLLASIAAERGNQNEARDLLLKVIYLAPAAPTAYLELGAIYDLEGDAARARKLRETALALLRALPAPAVVDSWSDVTAGELLQHLEGRVDDETVGP